MKREGKLVNIQTSGKWEISHVRAWEGEEIEWKIIKIHPKKIKKEKENRTSD